MLSFKKQWKERGRGAGSTGVVKWGSGRGRVGSGEEKESVQKRQRLVAF